MKKVALYSSSNRSRKTTAEEVPAEAPAGQGPAPAPAVAKGKSFYRRFEQPILVAAGALFAVALVLMYAKTRPVPPELTQKDIDQAVLHTLENTNLYTPTTSRIAGLTMIDILATGTALRRGHEYIERVQSMKAQLSVMRSSVGQREPR